MTGHFDLQEQLRQTKLSAGSCWQAFFVQQIPTELHPITFLSNNEGTEGQSGSV